MDSLWGQIELKEPPKEKDKGKDTEREKESNRKPTKYLSTSSFNSAEEELAFKRNDLSNKLFKKNFQDLREEQQAIILNHK